MNDAQRKVLAVKRVVRLAKTGRLTEFREAAGLSQSDIARYFGISPSNVSRWEAAKAKPRADRAVALLELLEAP